ncbi:putative phage tail protein [[Clostridium] symbiosum]|uniref:putative phage tail protein n=1 Tax=Clostridium symbiosum TaxID=1512 RepID=UPI001D06A0C3|nr:putative phage tail protein [[Clostridium] symbiosum]MCB6610152.1 YmfQ family protein [[Clostridium] symbiosum]MCB6933488.1 YmfQ family protein [[Clostridium] symbiosum]
MYGVEKYGKLTYALEKLEPEIQEEYFTDLSLYVPPFISSIREMKEIYQTQGRETGLLRYYLYDLMAQCFVSTSSWGITRWEELLGITTNLKLSYEQRREIVLAKIRGQGTTTKQMLKNTAESFSGGEVDVVEDSENHRFIVRFIGIKGIPRNMQAFVAMLEDIKPAHLEYRFEYTYTTWNSLKIFTWNDLLSKTWDEIRIMREVEYENDDWRSLGLYTWDMIYWKTWEEIK